MKSILFLCVANSARSQMAEGLASKLLGPSIRVQSAGSKPTSVNLWAVAVLAEWGVDIATALSSSVEDIDLQEVDTVITLCAEEVCPTTSTNITKLHWPIEDPATEQELSDDEHRERFRKARNEIHAHLKELHANWTSAESK